MTQALAQGIATPDMPPATLERKQPMSTGDLPELDVIIVGGGPAGLSAALVLGRCRRKVLICDAGKPRNHVAREMHGFLGRDGSEPAELRRLGREQLGRYDTVEFREILVKDAAPHPFGFQVELEDGERLRCRKLLLASGVKDELPEVEGFDAIYGASAHNCPYCDGWEWRDRPLAVYGQGSKGKGFALEMLGWSADIVLFSDGPSYLSVADREELVRNAITLDERRVAAFEHEDGMLQAVRLADGARVARQALFFATAAKQSCALASGLGCQFDERGSVLTGGYEASNVPGLYVAGDASRHAGMAIVAAAEGARAAFGINTELLQADRA